MLSQEEKIVYNLYAKKMTAKIEKSLLLIENFLKTYPLSYVSVSWGKDSIVTLDLCHRIKHDIDIVWVDRGDGGDTPEVYDLVNSYKKKEYNIIQVKTPYSILDLHRKYNIQELERHKIITKMLKKTLNKVNQSYCGFLWGIRADESKGRRMFARCKHECFMRTSTIATASPVLHWSSRDIWAYIASRNIEYNTFYDTVSTKPFERENIRYSNYAGLIGISYGRVVEIKRWYPKLYNAMIEAQPELRLYK